MQSQIKKFILTALAVLFLLFGVVGIFLPFLQGILFIIIGLVLLSFGNSAVQKIIAGKLAKYPKYAHYYESIRQKLSKYLD